jgi:hypothetical protein
MLTDTAVAVVAVLAGFALGYGFRGWYVRRHAPPQGQRPN